jgi:hypothetical protein
MLACNGNAAPSAVNAISNDFMRQSLSLLMLARNLDLSRIFWRTATFAHGRCWLVGRSRPGQHPA